MRFNPTTDYDSIVKNIQDLTDTNVSKYTLKQIARSVNNYLNRASHLLLEFSDNKNYDDPNFTYLPQGTYNIVNGERNITIFKDEEGKQIQKIRKVIAKDPSGQWYEIVPVDLQDRGEQEIAYGDQTGTPYSYDWVGTTMIFDVSPNYDMTDGLKVFYERSLDYFTEADTTKEPGLPEHFHDYLVYGASYDYCTRKGLQRKGDYRNMVEKIEQNLKSFMGNQSLEKNTRIRPIRVNVK